MVSPSKLHQQQQQQPQHSRTAVGRNTNIRSPRNGPTTTTTTSAAASATTVSGAATSGVRIQKGPKPLEKKVFYLDIKNHALSAKLEAKIKELGGAIELFLVKNVSLVVTDRSDRPGQAAAAAANSNDSRRRWGYAASGGSGGPPSLRSIEVPTPTPTPPTPYRSVEGPLSNSTNQRGGQPAQRSKSRVDAMLERALTQPQQCTVDPLSNALAWGLPIWSPYDLQAWLEKIAASLKDTQSLKRDNRTGSGKELKVKHLKEPYIKFESYRRETRPVFLELQSWPTLNFDGDPGSCPFDLKRRDKKEAAASINREIKENREKYCNPNITKGKDMTRRPRATATARARKTENTGYCEICRVDYHNLSKHLQSDQHLNFVGSDKNFLSLDNLIRTGASVEAFLKINRSKDVGKDCDLFSRRDHSLDNGIISSNNEKPSEKRTKSSLSDYGIDDLMQQQQQCNNGARRNLNLDSPQHNLRMRAKHESGHLLRSKGKPWHEEEKSDMPFEKYTIKKRAKGTIWIEEDDSEEEEDDDDDDEEGSLENEKSGKHAGSEAAAAEKNGKAESVSVNGEVDHPATPPPNHKLSSPKKVAALRESFLEANLKANGFDRKDDKGRKFSEVLNNSAENSARVNHRSASIDPITHSLKMKSERLAPGAAAGQQHHDFDDTMSLKSFGKDDRMTKYKPARRGGRSSYRGRQRLSVEERLIEDNRDYYKVEVLGNKLRSSAMPSVPVSPSKAAEQQQQQQRSKEEGSKPSSEKPVVVRFKRVRKSELSLLSDEAESFMFGDPRKDDDEDESSGDDGGEQSSILPKDTESDGEEAVESFVVSSSSPAVASVAPKQEAVTEDDSQDSQAGGSRARKRRRTQTEALLMDNTDYYKFETPGSRLRYQAPLTGICEATPDQDPTAQPPESTTATALPEEKQLYPSKPSPEVEKMHFSFEAVPRSEPWYQTYQRQDEGAEFWHCYSEIDTPKPFLLPYEIENFHEILHRSLQSSSSGAPRRGRRGRSRRGHGNMGSRSPRKSPRCHASTLAIMSTIIRRREQQQPTTATTAPLTTIQEEQQQPKAKAAASSEAAKSSEKKCSDKSDVDEDLKEMAKNIDEMMSSNDPQEEDSFEVDLLQLKTTVDDDDEDEGDHPNLLEPAAVSELDEPKGAPANLLELLDNCHEVLAHQNGLENSSCASSECGELGSESPLKRRRKKKRKNKTGWPGNKMRRKLHIKNLAEELQKELELQNKAEICHISEEEEVVIVNRTSIIPDAQEDNSTSMSHVSEQRVSDEDAEVEHETGKENERVVLNTIECGKKRGGGRGRRPKNKESGKEVVVAQDCSSEAKVVVDTTTPDNQGSKTVGLKSPVFSGDDVSSPRKKRLFETPEKCKVVEEQEEEEERKERDENVVVTDKVTTTTRHLDSINEDSEASNNENLKDNLQVSHEKHPPRTYSRKRQRNNTTATSSEASQQLQTSSSQSSSLVGSSPRKPAASSSPQKTVAVTVECRVESPIVEELLPVRKTQRSSSSKKKEETPLTANERRRLKKIKKEEDELQLQQNGELESSLVTSSDVDQRRSSIDFQPVVRVMKIEDQVDMDNSMLSVAVASSRRLRSSSSPRSSMQPPKKRFRQHQHQQQLQQQQQQHLGSSRRTMSRHWIKNS